MKAKLALQDGRIFEGYSFGAQGERFGEIVFNTSLMGYQEILTDPSYKGQIVTMTYPLIGNYGVNSEDVESRRPFVEGFVVKECSRIASNWRSEKSLDEYLKQNNIVGIEGVDTRALTRHIRLKGAMKAVISSVDSNNSRLVKKAKKSPGLIGRDLVKEVMYDKVQYWNQDGKYKVVVLDCGVKFNILRRLAENNCRVVVVPANFSVDKILEEKPDGILLSNGPGDPEGVPYVVDTVKKLMGKYPIFGICFGQQILGLAMGGRTYKLKFGHHGGNHPVKDLRDGRVAITVQNHGFCLDIDSLNKSDIEITHMNLNDNTLEGMRHKKLPIFSVQFHPEHGPGPHDAEYLFKEFVDLMKKTMPKRTDIKKIMIIGSGPIIISQACEFDYSGTQACKALKEEGFEVVLINSNPATIMTDPELADATYIEPITPEVIAKIIEKERPDALLPTLGGQTGLNTAMKLVELGVLDKFNVKMIGANYEVIKKAEDREDFKKAMQKIGLDLPQSALAYNMQEAKQALKQIGLPVIIRPSFTLGGTGGGIATREDEFDKIADLGLKNSMIGEILVEESIAGWKEYELEVMRDIKDNVVIVCSIENFDPMGIHTGDSITVAPAQTLSDREYQKMRNAAIAIIREIGVETGGSNIQFAVDPKTGRMVVIEMNPRVSRSSALASKATGFPIAKFAAKLAVGYTLDEIKNDITKETPASFEPAIDYCVVKIPRFTFEKFPEAEDVLGISMKSVGETMAIGRTFKEALQKGLRGLEIGHHGLDNKRNYRKIPQEKLIKRLRIPNASRIFYVKYALQRGMGIEELFEITKIDPWFISNIKDIVELEKQIYKVWFKNKKIDADLLKRAKEYGFSDKQISDLVRSNELAIRRKRKKLGIEATFKLVDTCAAEFEAYTPYYYSTYESEDESRKSKKKKIMILGGGPNRIGQGIEFDYCCCHASFALKELGYETIMVNSNPETVSTDYDTSDKLYFEPLTFEDVMNIIDKEKPDGVIVQFGGQTPLNLARSLEKAGAPIIGTSVKSIDRAENRDQFARVLNKLKIMQSPNGSAFTKQEAKKIANEIGYPVLVRPSYVLGGRAMKIVYNESSLANFMKEAQKVSTEHPVLIDKFLEDAIEVDVDAVSDGENTVIGGIMEHIEEAGVHSGDSACVLPPHTLGDEIIETIKQNTYALSKELKVKGLLNIQFAIKNDSVYVLEVNPRASRTVPFVSKATGVPLAKIAAKVMVGKKLAELGLTQEKIVEHFSVKESVLPFSRFSGVDILLGPEMKSTGEVMGINSSFGIAFYKSQVAAGSPLPTKGKIFISVKNSDKRNMVFIAERLAGMGFEIIATKGTSKALRSNNIKAEIVAKIGEGSRKILDLIKKSQINLIINTPSGPRGQSDMKLIRNSAVVHAIPIITTIQGAQAAVHGIESAIKGDLGVKSIQEYLR